MSMEFQRVMVHFYGGASLAHGGETCRVKRGKK